MTEQTEGAEVEALLPWLGDLVTFAVGAYAEMMIGAREAGDSSDWAEGIAREFCEARRPIELTADRAAAEVRGAQAVLAAVEGECAFAEEHLRHTANDEPLVETGLIRHTARAAAAAAGGGGEA